MEKNVVAYLEKHIGVRVDKVLAELVSDASRSQIQSWLKDGKVFVNGQPVKANYKLRPGDALAYEPVQLEEIDILPVDIPLDIVYEDDDILVIDKPAGMVVHPAPGHYNDTLVNGIMFHCKDSLSGINGVIRPGIVHRIDKDTSGLLVVCKNDKAHRHIARQLKDHSMTRHYEAIVYNNFADDSGEVEAPIARHPVNRKMMAIVPGGRYAKTHYLVLERLQNGFTHLQLTLDTGRTHQIRVHMASINHPLLGDDVYGPSKNNAGASRQMLHAKTLGLVHPSTGKYMEFNSELPSDFAKVLVNLRH